MPATRPLRAAPELMLLAVTFLVACGARTAPVTAGDDAMAVVDGFLDAASPDTPTDAAVDVIVVADTGPFACPMRRPLIGEGCDDEGLGCVYGDACKAECVCERGSWVCAADTCADSCPSRAPVTLRCRVAEVDRVCEYPPFCPITCRCELVADGARWNCISPPC